MLFYFILAFIVDFLFFIGFVIYKAYHNVEIVGKKKKDCLDTIKSFLSLQHDNEHENDNWFPWYRREIHPSKSAIRKAKLFILSLDDIYFENVKISATENGQIIMTFSFDEPYKPCTIEIILETNKTFTVIFNSENYFETLSFKRARSKFIEKWFDHKLDQAFDDVVLNNERTK